MHASIPPLALWLVWSILALMVFMRCPALQAGAELCFRSAQSLSLTHQLLLLLQDYEYAFVLHPPNVKLLEMEQEDPPTPEKV